MNYNIEYLKAMAKLGSRNPAPALLLLNGEDFKNLQKILESENTLIENIYDITKRTLAQLKNQDIKKPYLEWQKDELYKLLLLIFQMYMQERAEGKMAVIIKDIGDSIDLIEDENYLLPETPKSVFKILKLFILRNVNFEQNFNQIKDLIVAQYQASQIYEKKFNGWEWIGGGMSQFGGHFTIHEKSFVLYALKPALETYFKEKPEQAWTFVRDKCVAKTEEVSAFRPDFLNRASVKVILNKLKNDNSVQREEIFEILEEFILSKKGLPHKSDLIYEELDVGNFDYNLKWKLLKVSTDKYNLPINPFAGKLMAELVRGGNEEARQANLRWLDNPKYYDSFRMGDNLNEQLSAMFEQNHDLGIDAFRKISINEYFRDKYDYFETYGIADVLHYILEVEFDKSKIIVTELLAQAEKLSKSQQILACYSLFNAKGGDDSDSPEFLMKVYESIVNPFLQECDNNIEKIVGKISIAGCRATFVQFACRLATQNHIAEALKIIEVFVNDPDPYLPGQDPDDQDDKYNEHKRILEGQEPRSITSVRGWCGWALMKCSVPNGRIHVDKIIRLSQKLADDENYYTIHMACFALGQLAVNRLTVMPPERTKLFFSDDTATALKLAKEVEKTAFNLLGRLASWPELVQKALAKSILHVFDPIRALSEDEAWQLVTALQKLQPDAVAEAAPLLIFYAYLRKDAYKNWKFSMPGFYDKLSPEQYHEQRFVDVLDETIKRLQSVDSDKCFRFAASFEHLMREGGDDQAEKERFAQLTLSYFSNLFSKVYSHHVFDLMYRTIKEKTRQQNPDFDQWYELYKSCLETESKYYATVLANPENQANPKYQGMYWWPSFENFEILQQINRIGGKEKFLTVAKIVFSFPKEFALHETADVIELLKQYLPDERAQDAINNLSKRSSTII